MIFQTKRLRVRLPEVTKTDIDLYYNLWNNPEVMKFVGFPHGLKITKDEVKNTLSKYDSSEYDKTLIMEEKESGRMVGECKLGIPDENDISITDLKLFPEFQGKGYGKEIKNALCRYLFINTTCQIVEASPNKENVASIKMQESCGGVKVDESIYEFPENMKEYTQTVHSYIYHIHREKWIKRNNTPAFIMKRKNVNLRSMIPSDIDDLKRWNEQNLKAWEFDGPWYSDDLSFFIKNRKKYLSSYQDEPYRFLEIETKEGKHIGWVNVMLKEDDPHMTEFGIDIVEDAVWCKGLGTECVTLWLNYLFETYNLSRIGFSTWSGNFRMIRVGEKLGFTHEACIRKGCEVKGKFYDRIKMGILRVEWEK